MRLIRGDMGKKADAKKDSTAVAGTGSGGRDAVNINIGSNGENRVLLGQVVLNITLVIALLINLLLLHIVIVKIRHLTVAVNRIEELEEKQEQLMKSFHGSVYVKILLNLVLLIGHEMR